MDVSKNIIEYNDWIIFRNQTGKEWLREIQQGKSLHTHKGFVNYDSIVGKPLGSIVKVQNDQILLLSPRPGHLIRNMMHRTNIIYEGDAVAMLSSAGVGPGDTVLEVGTGSGGLTLYLAFYITRNNSKGKIISYDIKNEHSEAAQKNLKKFGLFSEQTEFNVGNINEKLEKLDYFDAVFVDVQKPWEILEKCAQVVKPGCSIVIFLPNWNQVELTVKSALDTEILTVLDVFETNRRPMDVKPEKHVMRPKFRSIVYSGILIHLVKTQFIERETES